MARLSYVQRWRRQKRPANAEVDEFDLTAHANREDLLNFVTEVNPRTILLGHGDQDAREWFEQQIRARHPKIQIIQPTPGKSVEV